MGPVESEAGPLVEALDTAELACLAAETILARSRHAIAQRGVFHLALSGGSTPRATYAELARRAGEVDFSNWELWYGDERCVPPDDEGSNHRMVVESWLERVARPPRVHRIRGEADPAAEAVRYEAELRDRLGPEPRLDLVLLGLGTDAHTASLFPGSPALHERISWVTSSEAPVEPRNRITLTFPALNAARAVLFLVSGASKIEALQRARNPGTPIESAPARGVRPRTGECTWMADAAALGR
jgi:6-phosphogluconolactonase